MKDKWKQSIEKFQKRRKRWRNYQFVLLILVFATLLGVSWQLHRTGISMADQDPYVSESAVTDSESTDSISADSAESLIPDEAADPGETPAAEEITEPTETSAADAADSTADQTNEAEAAEEMGAAVPVQQSSDPLDMSSYISSLTGSGTKYDANGKVYSSELKIEFSFPSGAAQQQGGSYYYEYPQGILIPDGLMNGKTYELNDKSGRRAGTYYFEKTETGTYRVRIDFDESYLQTTRGDIEGYLQFAGQIAEDAGSDDGSIKIVGKDGVEIDIPKDEITYPDGETNRYDIHVTKGGSYSSKDGKLTYTAYVYSIKGTPDDILFEDTIQAENMTLGTPEISVVKETVTRYYHTPEGNGSYQDITSQNPESVSVSPVCEDGHFSFYLPKIETAEEANDPNSGYPVRKYTRYKIEYTYDVGNLTAEEINAQNTAQADSRNNTTEVKDSADCAIKITNTYTIKKSGSFDEKNNVINWTITVNEQNRNIAGGRLTDDRMAALAEGTNLTVTPSEGYQIERDADGKITALIFTPLANGENRNTYTIRYQTKAEGTWYDQKVYNEAHFQPGDGSGEISGSTSVTVKGGKVEKSSGTGTTTEDGRLIIPWTVTLTLPEDGLPAGTVIQDTLAQDGGKQYMTREQVISWMQGIHWINQEGSELGIWIGDANVADVRFQTLDGKEFTYQEIQDYVEAVRDEVYTGYTITLKQDLIVPAGVKQLKFSYQTTAEPGSDLVGTVEFKNKITVGDRSANASYTYKKGGVIKTDENGKTGTTEKENADGTLTWKITVLLPESSKTLTVTDTLPDGVTLVGIAGADRLSNEKNIQLEEDGTIFSSSNDYQISGTYQNHKVTLKLSQTNGKELHTDTKYTFVLTCKVQKDQLGEDYEAGKTYVFQNQAEASDDQGKIGSAEQTQDWKEKKNTEDTRVIQKNGLWDNNSRRVKYSIRINPEGKKLMEGSDASTLTLKDVFQYYPLKEAYPPGEYNNNGSMYHVSAWVVPSTVKLYRAEKQADGTWAKGDEVTDWSWTVTTQTGNVNYPGDLTNSSTIIGKNIPDGTPLILEYEYQIQTDIPEGYHTSYSISVSNKADLEGTGYSDHKGQQDVNWGIQDTAGEVEGRQIYQIYKVSEGNYGETLRGAVFRMQKYEDGTYQDTDITYTTDENGAVFISWRKYDTDIAYEHNVLYRLVEITAPDGYELPDNAEEQALYFYFSDSEDLTHTLPAEIPEQAVDLSQRSYVSYVENEKSTTEITIQKKWQKPDGSIDAGHPGKIQIALYQRESASGTERLYQTYEILAEENWTKTITDLPRSGIGENREKVSYTYYIEELNGRNYDSSYENNEGIASGVITVTNKMSESPSYELPETGGSGTTWFTTGGMILMSAVLLYGIKRILIDQKRKNGGNDL